MKALVFDMDGVIIDSEPINLEVQHEIFSELNINLTKDEYFSFVGTSSKNMWQQLKKRFGLPHTIEDLIAMGEQRSLKHLKKLNDLEPINGVRDIINQAINRNIKLGLASSATMTNIQLVLKKFELKSVFQHCISGDDLQHSKPHPEIFFKAARLLEVSPNQCLVIEDSANGVKAAKAAGMKCVGFKNINSGQQDLSEADIIVTGLHKIDLGHLQEKLFHS